MDNPPASCSSHPAPHRGASGRELTTRSSAVRTHAVNHQLGTPDDEAVPKSAIEDQTAGGAAGQHQLVKVWTC